MFAHALSFSQESVILHTVMFVKMAVIKLLFYSHYMLAAMNSNLRNVKNKFLMKSIYSSCDTKYLPYHSLVNSLNMMNRMKSGISNNDPYSKHNF